MLIRYPGSKDKHLKFLSEFLVPQAQASRSVMEPFAGTAAVTFHLLEKKAVDRYWINDFDESMAALWTTVRDRPDDLIALIHSYTPAAQDFYDFKSDPGTETLERAFRKVVLHQISYSGLGGKAGSPIGGRNQTGSYLVDCRWNAKRLESKIMACSALLNSAEGTITASDWKPALEGAIAQDFFVYLDPPYFVRGVELYVNGVIDHRDLAETLKASPHASWMVSYDDAPEVRDLYSWANVERLDVISHLHHKSIGDVLIRKSSA